MNCSIETKPNSSHFFSSNQSWAYSQAHWALRCYFDRWVSITMMEMKERNDQLTAQMLYILYLRLNNPQMISTPLSVPPISRYCVWRFERKWQDKQFERRFLISHWNFKKSAKRLKPSEQEGMLGKWPYSGKVYPNGMLVVLPSSNLQPRLIFGFPANRGVIYELWLYHCMICVGKIRHRRGLEYWKGRKTTDNERS